MHSESLHRLLYFAYLETIEKHATDFKKLEGDERVSYEFEKLSHATAVEEGYDVAWEQIAKDPEKEDQQSTALVLLFPLLLSLESLVLGVYEFLISLDVLVLAYWTVTPGDVMQVGIGVYLEDYQVERHTHYVYHHACYVLKPTAAHSLAIKDERRQNKGA